jgi:hypothetical protein
MPSDQPGSPALPTAALGRDPGPINRHSLSSTAQCAAASRPKCRARIHALPGSLEKQPNGQHSEWLWRTIPRAG